MVKFFRCNLCGNVVALIKEGGGTLVCCGKEMEELKANSTEAAQEKHVPVITKEGGKLNVAVGSVAHPMLPEHYIEWIALVSGSRVEFKYLQPGDKPEAEFENASEGTVYAYCNLHGLWKAEI